MKTQLTPTLILHTHAYEHTIYHWPSQYEVDPLPGMELYQSTMSIVTITVKISASEHQNVSF